MLLQPLAREQCPPVAGSVLGFPRGGLAGRAISLFGSMQAAAPTTSRLGEGMHSLLAMDGRAFINAVCMPSIPVKTIIWLDATHMHALFSCLSLSNSGFLVQGVPVWIVCLPRNEASLSELPCLGSAAVVSDEINVGDKQGNRLVVYLKRTVSYLTTGTDWFLHPNGLARAQARAGSVALSLHHNGRLPTPMRQNWHGLHHSRGI